MKHIATLICLFSLALLGCHKKETAVAPSPAPASPNAATPETPAIAAQPQPQIPRPQAPAEPAKPLPPPPAYVTANADNNLRQSVVGQVDGELTSALRSFVHKRGRMPQSFFEFTAGAVDSLPRPPEGKRWVIDSSDMTVKAVNK